MQLYLLDKFPKCEIISSKGICIYSFVSYCQTSLYRNGTNFYFNQVSMRVPIFLHGVFVINHCDQIYRWKNYLMLF